MLPANFRNHIFNIWQHFNTRMLSSRMCTGRLLTISQHEWLGGHTCQGGVPAGGCIFSFCLPGVCTCQFRGVYLLGVYLLGGIPARGCTCLGVPAEGVYLLEGVPAGGVPARECTCQGMYLLGVYLPGRCTCQGVPAQVLPPREQNDRQVQKYYLAPNFVCGR